MNKAGRRRKINKTKIGRVAEWLLRLSVKQIPNGAAGSNPAPPNFFVLPNAAPMSFHIKSNPSGGGQRGKTPT